MSSPRVNVSCVTCPNGPELTVESPAGLATEVVSKLWGPGVMPVPHLQDVHMFHPLCVIGKRVERSLRMRKVRSLFPLGPLSDLMDNPGDPTALTPDLMGDFQKEEPVRCDFLHEEFLDGVGRVRVQVTDYYKECGVYPMPPRRLLALRDSLPWLDSVHRLYLVSQTFLSSSCRLCMLGGERRTERCLGPDTPLAFTCLRLSVSPSGLVEVCCGWEGSCLHPQAHWARFGSPEYNALVAGTSAEPRAMNMLSQFAFSIVHPSSRSLPGSASFLFHSQEQQQAQSSSGYRQEQEASEQALLPLDDDEEGGEGQN